MNINYNFGAITEGKVYKSGAMDEVDLPKQIQEHGIRTVIDLRNEVTERISVEEERALIEGIAGVQYINIKSPQMPTDENIAEFLAILDDEANYPVLIHCYHGLGRTMLYTAVYRIEYEYMDNKDARQLTRPYPVESFIYDSSFAEGRSKGDYLINYIPRDEVKN
jgi:protein tyrosine/serine phosphatase